MSTGIVPVHGASNPARPAWGDRLLIRLYPAAWRDRYGAEFAALLSERRPGWLHRLDIVRGAVDARLHPEVVRRPPALARATASAAAAALIAPPEARSSAYGLVAESPPLGEISRRGFLRRVMGVGVALLGLEFFGGTLNFLWPQIREGLGAEFRLGTLQDILAAQPTFASGWPYVYNPARIFLVNVPAARELALGGQPHVTDPDAAQLLALWRRCPHLGCLVPEPCESVTRYRCRCHGSTYNILGEKLEKGPAERGMDRFAVRIDDDGMVVVDTSLITQGAPNRGQRALEFDDGHPWTATCTEA